MKAWAALLALFCASPGFAQTTPLQTTPLQITPLIVTDETSALAKTALLQRAFSDVETYFATRHDIALKTNIILLGTDAPERMNDMLAAALKSAGRRGRTTPFDVAALCDGKRLGAASNRGYIVMCWNARDRQSVALTPDFATYLTAILAHEVTHHFQYQLAQDDPPRRLPDKSDILLGPNWMVEGMAEVIESDFQRPLADVVGKDIFDFQSRARRSRLKLADLQQSGSVKGGAAYGVARFACVMLARKHGIAALFAYFEALGRLGDRDRAFEATFQQSFAEFEVEFETLRRDFGAARDYGKGGL